MKILIIGSGGMLGSELVRTFVDEKVIAWDIKDLDITDKDTTNTKITEIMPDLIINASAYNEVDKAEEERDMAIRVNGYAPGYLAKIAKEIGSTLVHYSTDYVFDGERESGYKELDVPKPINVYGASKLLGELEVAKNTNNYYIIRLSKLFGKSGNGENVKKSFVDKMLELAKEKTELDVVNEELSSPTYAPDLAERTKYIIEAKMPNGIYHSANSGSCTWSGFAEEIFKLSNIDIKLNPISGNKFLRLAKRPKFSTLLNVKLPDMRDWKEALKEYLLNK